MRQEEASDLELLMSHADDDSPVLAEGLPHDSAAAQEIADPGEEQVLSFYDLGAAGNDLMAQGWGVIAPEGERGDELLARIRPLIDHRAEQLDEELRIYRVPPRMGAEEAMRWRRDVYNQGDPDLIPRYQLFLGDLHEVSIELQAAQGPEGFVGRLAFSDLEGYEAYVEKVLRSEAAGAQKEAADSVFYTVHDGTGATRIGHRALIEPVVALAREQLEAGRFLGDAVRELGDRDEPNPDELLDAAGSLAGDVLFTMSHGAGAPRRGWNSTRAQLLDQGAMSFGREGKIYGRDIAGKRFNPGGVWFMFACFGAGTPTRSKFFHWLSQLRDGGQFRGRPEMVLKSLPAGEQRPFVAAVPQAALASPEGPLAFVGHLDLAWTYSFLEIDQGKQRGRPAKYYNVVRSMTRGDRVGVALHELERFYNDKNQELTELYDLDAEAQVAGKPSPVDRSKIGHLWMVRQDLSGYILLGDPAVRLPISPRKKKQKKAALGESITLTSQAAPRESAPAREASSFAAHDGDDEAPAAESTQEVAADESATWDAGAEVAAEEIAADESAPGTASEEAPREPASGDFGSEVDDDAPPVSPDDAATGVATDESTDVGHRPRPSARRGEVGGECEIREGDAPATSIRWRVRWQLGGERS